MRVWIIVVISDPTEYTGRQTRRWTTRWLAFLRAHRQTYVRLSSHTSRLRQMTVPAWPKPDRGICSTRALVEDKQPTHQISSALPDAFLWKRVLRVPWVVPPAHDIAFALSRAVTGQAVVRALQGRALDSPQDRW